MSNLGVAIIFNAFSIIGITGLLNILHSIESPFDEYGMDDIRLTPYKLQFMNELKEIFDETK